MNEEEKEDLEIIAFGFIFIIQFAINYAAILQDKIWLVLIAWATTILLLLVYFRCIRIENEPSSYSGSGSPQAELNTL